MTAPLAEHPALMAWLDMHDALAELADHGRRAPCQIDPEPFTADTRAERREAEQACAACPIATLCRAYADTAAEPWHVWGGQDQAPTSGPRKGSTR